MFFGIQAGNPRFQSTKNFEDETLSEAIESMFPLYTENMIMVWNYICIPISYKYDLSYMIDDILRLINSIQKMDVGKMNIHWLPDTFRCDWIVEWNSEELQIISRWECTMGHLEDILNQNNIIRILKDDFVCEWKNVLGIIIKGLNYCGYDEVQIKGISKLFEVYEEIKSSGIYYKG